MKIKVVDLETSIKCPIGNNKANPMWRANKIVAAGVLDISSEPNLYSETYGAGTKVTINNNEFIVGHNIKFDLLYIYKDITHPILPNIWDTQLAEYILTAQQAKYASLDELTIKYVSDKTVKDTKIKEYWASGVDTEDIPKKELLEYMYGDVSNTAAIFKAQWELANQQGQLPLIMAMMDALRATTCMNLSGMAVDWEYVDKQKKDYTEVITYLEKRLGEEVPELDFKSPKQLSLFFFGGEEKITVTVEDGFYKNGNPKTKREVKTVVHAPLVDAKKLGFEKGKNGYYSVDESVLSIISKVTTAKVHDIVEIIKNYRKYSKILHTYYDGLSAARFPSGFIYPQLNHVSTETGRLSCTSPNLQNQTDEGDIKKSFISRYGKNGLLIELDYSQLEIVWLAYLSKDKQLIADINDGIDIHTVLYKEMYGVNPTRDERKAFKPRSFQLIYGAGPTAIAEQGGISLAEAKQFIKVFYGRYKGVKKYHEDVLKAAEDNKKLSYLEAIPDPIYNYTLKMPWGRHYFFKTYKNDWTRDVTFSPTQLKNYPIQGSATGDHVPFMVGLLQRELEETKAYKEGKVQLVMTVHDSVLLDVHNEFCYDISTLARKVLEKAPEYLKNKFGISFPCKLSVGVAAGSNWQNMEDVKEI